MMATVQKRGSSYKITVSCGYDMTGKQLRQHMTWTPELGMTERQIEKELERQKVLFEERAKTGIVQDGGIRFQSFAEKWLEDYGRKQLKLKTHTEYEKRLVRINQAIGHIRLRDLKPGHLNSFYSNLAETGVRADKRYTCKIDLIETIKSLDMTRAAFAKSTDISEATIRAIAAGRKINKESAAKISKAVGVKLSELFTQEDPDRALSSSTVRTYHRVISSILSKGVKWGFISYNPAINAELPKIEDKEAVHLDETDARRLLELLHDEPIKYRAMITFDLLSGLRRGELLGLRWRDVDFKNETISIVQTSAYVAGTGVYTDTPKNKTSSRPLKLSRSAFLLLIEYKNWQDSQREACGDFWKDKDGRIFTGDDGAPVHPDALTKWFKAFVTRTGLPDGVHVHSLRHTYASLMIADGTPLVVVSKRLGHAQVSTTANIYAHVIASADEKAAQITERFSDVIAPAKPRKSNTA